MFGLARTYAGEGGVTQDVDQALALLRKSASLGYEKAQRVLAHLGLPVPKQLPFTNGEH
jgi:TPR repeat protein